jgi:twitching motility protein PilT
MTTIADLLVTLRERKGSDLHLASGRPVKIRLHGDLEALSAEPLSASDVADLLRPIVPDDTWASFLATGDADLAWQSPGTGRFRVNLFRDRGGPGAVFRQIPEKILPMESLRLPPAVYEIPKLRSGLVLVTGPTGSGKSTTLAAILDRINSARHDHVVTIEEPIEFVHHSQGCLVTQREVGEHARSFSAALRGALREDPDVLLVGEMRDLETVSLALTAAETGLLVFGTLHTNSAAKAVDRIIDVFPAAQQPQAQAILAGTLRVVVAQILLKRADGQGRVAAYEVLNRSVALGRLIRAGETHMIEGSFRKGHGDQTMDQALLELLSAGLVDRGEVALKLKNKPLLDAAGG